MTEDEMAKCHLIHVQCLHKTVIRFSGNTVRHYVHVIDGEKAD